MQGKIIKGIAGFYYVYTQLGVFECKAKGIFRKDNNKPLVGDDVTIEILEEQDNTGSITEILPRKNSLIRPAVANVDQVMFLFSIKSPKPNLGLLDRLMIAMSRQGIPCLLCFNKLDIATEKEIEELRDTYQQCGCKIFFISAKQDVGIEMLKNQLSGNLTVLSGPSGVGKSTVINRICPDANMIIGDISRKIERGRHTTRHSEIFAAFDNTYLCDTPGFTSFHMIDDIEKEEIRDYYLEFAPYQEHCKFRGCVHVGEPDCAVKNAVEANLINSKRYENYIQIYQEINERKRF